MGPFSCCVCVLVWVQLYTLYAMSTSLAHQIRLLNSFQTVESGRKTDRKLILFFLCLCLPLAIFPLFTIRIRLAIVIQFPFQIAHIHTQKHCKAANVISHLVELIHTVGRGMNRYKETDKCDQVWRE